MGVSRAVYENLKLLRIPFTRARDSMTVLVVKDYQGWDPTRLCDGEGRDSRVGQAVPVGAVA